MKKTSIEYEKLVRDPDEFLDKIDGLARSLGYKHSKYCGEKMSTVAIYHPKTDELLIHDNKKIEEANKQLLEAGLRQTEDPASYYKMITFCGHFYNTKGLLRRKTEGIIIKVRMEGWDTQKNKESGSLKSLGLMVTDAEMYGWGPKWNGLLNKSFDHCFKKNLKVPKKELIIKLVEGEIERRFGQKLNDNL